jgi:methylated-DNA-[protein]-cysteine S-methyltransferase
MTHESATAIFDSPVGPLFASVDAGHLTQLSFYRRGPCAERSDDDTLLDAVKQQLREYFDGRRRTFDLPLYLSGPSFYRRVWTALTGIPYGETISYGELAKNVGDPEGARAVGAANGANPVAIIVPCHRVIGADGRLVGYGGGLKRKRILLDLEAGRIALPIA